MAADEPLKTDFRRETVNFAVTVVELKGDEKKFICKNSIRKFTTDETWFDVFCDVCEHVYSDEIDKNFEKIATVDVSKSSTDTEIFHPDPYDCISVLTDFDKNLKYVTIKLNVTMCQPNLEHQPHSSASKTAFDILMSGGRALKKAEKKSEDKSRFTAKDRLHNELIENLDDLKFPASMPPDEMTRRLMVVVDALWYIDGSHEKINLKVAASEKIPLRFEKYNGYNDYKKKRKAAPVLNSTDLKRHASLLFRLASSAIARSIWGELTEEINRLALSLDSYAAYLENANQKQKYRQSLSTPARPVGDHTSVEGLPSCKGPIKACYSILDETLKETSEYTPIYFDENVHIKEPFKNADERRKFLNSLSLSYPVDILSYDPGAGLGKTVFIWRVPQDRSPVEVMSSAAKIFKTVECKLPEYHTREMRREFVREYQTLADVPQHVLRAIYSDLTLDATACQNPAIEARLRHALVTGDSDLVIDLRHINKGRPDETFEVFFKQLEKEVVSYTATDERRHDGVQHFSKYLSVRDLIDQTSKLCPEGTPIPSESTVLFAFVPKNAFKNTAKLFKGRIDLQHKVQTRQLRASHIDEHYCATIFNYLKHYALEFKEHTSLLCLDDKSKVDFGEPGMAVATGVRGKKSLVPCSSVLGALDHDVASKGSLTPSVCLHVDIPDTVTNSFYRGQVYVTLKDSVFQPSSPFRHATELKYILKPTDDASPNPIILLFTDGGPDHRTTYAAVKLSLIVLFKLLDLDILVAARTAPGHSWANPAERIMSLLNLAYQNVAVYRSEMAADYEQMLKACSSMNDIRKKAEKEPGLEQAWLKAVEQIITLLNERSERVQLKGKPFRGGNPATKQEISEFESNVRRLVDPDIVPGKYTKNDLKNLEGYRKFMDDHCRERNYIFQAKKKM